MYIYASIHKQFTKAAKLMTFFCFVYFCWLSDIALEIATCQAFMIQFNLVFSVC